MTKFFKLFALAALILFGVAGGISSTKAGELSPAEQNLVRSASNYMKALSEGASKDELNVLFAQWTYASSIAVHSTPPERLREPACWYPALVARQRKIDNPLEVLVRDCFGLDPMAALTTAEYRP